MAVRLVPVLVVEVKLFDISFLPDKWKYIELFPSKSFILQISIKFVGVV